MKKALIPLIGFLAGVCGITAQAQEKRLEAGVSADFVSQYIWRGQRQGGVSFQPTTELSYKGFSVSASSNLGLVNPTDQKELNVAFEYNFGGLSLYLTDYWDDDGPDLEKRYFHYAARTTNHVFEAGIGYDFGFASLGWFTNFGGDDGENNNGKRAYSSYLELTVPLISGDETTWVATAGVSPFATTYYDNDRFSVVYLALTTTYNIRITDDFTLPLFATLASNPANGASYLVVGFRLQH